MRIEVKQLSDLRFAECNPRTISDAAYKGLQRSIARFGLVELIIWNERTDRIVHGEQRLKALVEAGETETSVVVVDLPKSEAKALNLALNNPDIAGTFTDDVADILAELRLELPDMIEDLRLDQISIELPANDIAAEWQGMPEYESENIGPYRQLIVSFRNEQDVQKFGALINQQITPKTKSFWWPAAEPEATVNLYYMDEEAA
jgi:hypothetical protein